MGLTFLLVRPTPETSCAVRSREAAIHLGVSQKKLRQLVRRGEIPVIQNAAGGPWFYRVSDLDAYIHSQVPREFPLPAGTSGFDVQKEKVIV